MSVVVDSGQDKSPTWNRAGLQSQFGSGYCHNALNMRASDGASTPAAYRRNVLPIVFTAAQGRCSAEEIA